MAGIFLPRPKRRKITIDMAMTVRLAGQTWPCKGEIGNEMGKWSPRRVKIQFSSSKKTAIGLHRGARQKFLSPSAHPSCPRWPWVMANEWDFRHWTTHRSTEKVKFSTFDVNAHWLCQSPLPVQLLNYSTSSVGTSHPVNWAWPYLTCTLATGLTGPLRSFVAASRFFNGAILVGKKNGSNWCRDGSIRGLGKCFYEPLMKHLSPCRCALVSKFGFECQIRWTSRELWRALKWESSVTGNGKIRRFKILVVTCMT